MDKLIDRLPIKSQETISGFSYLVDKDGVSLNRNETTQVVADIVNKFFTLRCIPCGEDFYRIPSSGQDECDSCIEATCVKCGGEGSQKLAGDESAWVCNDCGYIDMNK